jgi:hypothetical protein
MCSYIIMHLSFIFLLLLLAPSSFFRFLLSSSFSCTRRISSCCCRRLNISCDRASSSACSSRASTALCESTTSNSGKKKASNLTLGFGRLSASPEPEVHFLPCVLQSHLLQVLNEQNPSQRMSSRPHPRLRYAPRRPMILAGIRGP